MDQSIAIKSTSGHRMNYMHLSRKQLHLQGSMNGFMDLRKKTKLATSVDCGATFLFWYNEAIFQVPH